MTGNYVISTFEGGADGTTVHGSTQPEMSGIVSGPTGYNTITYSAANAFHGATGLLMTVVQPGGNAAGIGVQYKLTDTPNKVSISLMFKTPSSYFPISGNIIRISNTAGTTSVSFAWRSTGTASTTGFYVGDSASSFVPVFVGTTIGNNTWYRITFTADNTTATSTQLVGKVYDASGNLKGTGSTATANGGTTPFQYVWPGFYVNNATSSYSFGMDDFQMQSQSTVELAPYSPPANNPPTASVGGPYTSNAGVPVSLVGTATDTDGTIASVQWAAVSWPGSDLATPTTAPYIGNATSSTATVTLTTPGVYRFSFIATDNLGLQSTSVNATVYITAATATPVATTANYGWTGVYTALGDSDDTSYVESPASAVSAASYVARLAPLNPPNAFNLTVRAYLSAANPGSTVTVNLLEGSTTRKTWTISPTLTVADYVLSLSSGEIATVGSWNALDVQVVWQTTS